MLGTIEARNVGHSNREPKFPTPFLQSSPIDPARNVEKAPVATHDAIKLIATILVESRIRQANADLQPCKHALRHMARYP